MSTVASTGISLSQNYYLRNYYKINKNASKTSTRKDISSKELSYDDATALHRAAKKLMSYDYSSNENGSNIANSILAYVDTYNNALTSAQNSDNADVERYAKQLKKLSKKYSSELADIGITVNSDGTMKAKNTTLTSSKITKVKKAFETDNGFMKTTMNYARKLEDRTYQDMYTQLTGSGSHVNTNI